MQRRIALSAVLIVLATGAILWAMGRPPICTCGRVDWWGVVGPTQSQMLADWYSPSHLIHGFLFYALLAWVWRRAAFGERLTVALFIECAWEIVENTPLVIDRYREATVALGYSGDSIVNSMSDIAMMVVGFLAASRLPVWASFLIIVGLELLTLAIIRDNLTLNVWMLLFPSPAIVAWQGAA